MYFHPLHFNHFLYALRHYSVYHILRLFSPDPIVLKVTKSVTIFKTSIRVCVLKSFPLPLAVILVTLTHTSRKGTWPDWVMTSAPPAPTEAASFRQSYVGTWHKFKTAAETDPFSNFPHLDLASGKAKLTHGLGKEEEVGEQRWFAKHYIWKVTVSAHVCSLCSWVGYSQELYFFPEVLHSHSLKGALSSSFCPVELSR